MNKNFSLILIWVFAITGMVFAAVDFDGSADYINVAADASFTAPDDITVSLWVNPDDLDPVVVYPIANFSDDDQSGDTGWGFGIIGIWSVCEDVDGTPFVYETTTNITVCGSTNTIVSSNTWTHMAFTNDQTTTRIYVNGIETDNGVHSWDNPTGIDLIVGRRGDASWYFDGQIDDVRVYDRVLTANELLAIYNSRRKRTGGITDWISNLTATDASGNGNDGTLIDGPKIDIGYTGSGSLYFDKVNDEVNITDAANMDDTPEFSWAFWLKMTAETGSSGGFPFHKNGVFYHRVWNALSHVALCTDDTVFGLVHAAGYSPTQETWSHFAVTYSSGSSYLFVNGSTVNFSSSHTGDVCSAATDVELGERFGDFYGGNMDEFKYFNVNLSTQDVADIYNGVAISTNPIVYLPFDDAGAGLVGHWELNDRPIGSTVTASGARDVTGKGNHGSGNGGASIQYIGGPINR